MASAGHAQDDHAWVWVGGIVGGWVREKESERVLFSFERAQRERERERETVPSVGICSCPGHFNAWQVAPYAMSVPAIA
eukprot:1081094-Rhodomonas_salina.2